ncbi:hypothetical protein Efla_000021 [Eimeria flavescens]
MARPVKPRKARKEADTAAARKAIRRRERGQSASLSDALEANKEKSSGLLPMSSTAAVEIGSMQLAEFAALLNKSSLPKKETSRLIAAYRLLQEQLESSRRETAAVTQLVASLSDGAVPLPIPLEVFYRIGQQYLAENAHLFSLHFPPLETTQAGDTAATLSSEERAGGLLEEEEKEEEQEEEHELKEGEEEGAGKGEEGGGEEEGGEEEGYFDELRELEELNMQENEVAGRQQDEGIRKKAEGGEKQLSLPGIAERTRESLFALVAWKAEEAAEQKVSSLLQQLSIKSKLTETLQQQNQLLMDKATQQEGKVELMQEKYFLLEEKVKIIEREAEELKRRAADKSKGSGEKKENASFLFRS